ncbi:hypothetical protein TrST_g1853 [Triparma strigata]|uniref:SSD domain-containing protein n=1 Tax=Triparma strigata TaxID=1606541 RepID=A0A9W7BJX0_9STRA|nr:hypothetical protein TrST_g1853 [Triparma strigata]
MGKPKPDKISTLGSMVPPPPEDWEGWKEVKYNPAFKGTGLGNYSLYLHHSREIFLDNMSNFFFRLGARIEPNPKLVIFISLFVTCLFIPGIFLLKAENEALYLWVPQETQVWEDFLYVRENYGGQRRVTTLLITAPDREDLLDGESIRSMINVHNNLTSVFQNKEGRTFRDFCVKDGKGRCQVENFLSIWDYNASKVEDDKHRLLYQINQYIDNVPASIQFGGVTYAPDGSGVLLGFKAARMQYYCTNDIPTTVTNLNNNTKIMAKQWEKIAFWYDPLWQVTDWEANTMSLLKGFSPIIDVNCVTKRSVDDEVYRLVIDDTPLFLSAIFCIILWLALTFGRQNIIEARFLLTWTVAIEIACCLIFSYGVLGYMGVRVSSLNAIVPFVIAGVSVDDMIVIEDFFNKAEGKKNRMAECLKAAGVAITTTSLTSIAAFFTGAWCDMPGVKSFCLGCFLAFTWDFVLNITLFPALILIDQRRIDANRHFLFPCIEVDESHKARERSSSMSAHVERQKSVKSVNTLSSMGGLSRAGSSFSRSAYISIRGYKEKPSAVEHFMYAHYGSFLQYETVQMWVLILFSLSALLLGVMSYFAGVGLTIQNVLPYDSYIIDFVESVDSYFPTNIDQLGIIVRDLDYTDSTQVSNMFDYFGFVQRYDRIEGNVGMAPGSWYANYAFYLYSNDHDIYKDFPTYLEEWFEGDGESFKSDVVCKTDDEPNRAGKCVDIVSSIYKVWHSSPDDTMETYRVQKDLNEGVTRYGLPKNSYVFSEIFLFAVTDWHMYGYICWNLFLTIVIVMVVMLIFTDNISCFFITLMVIFIDADLMGMMYFLDINISAVSFICILMSIGLSVDYCVHIGHAFTHSDGETPNMRLVEAVKLIGTSVLKGGMTTFLGTIVLAFSGSDAFRTFFKMMLMTVIFGMLHGLMCLPVFLTMFYNLAGRAAHYENDKGQVGSKLAKGARTKKEIKAGKRIELAGVEVTVKSRAMLEEEVEEAPPPPPSTPKVSFGAGLFGKASSSFQYDDNPMRR